MLLIVCAVLLGCSATKKTNREIRNARNTFAQHPDSFANYCSRFFPVSDSIGRPTIDFIKADNQNHSEEIDSLKSLVLALKEENSRDTSNCAKRYESRIVSLTKRITDLRNVYRPCSPDTVIITNNLFRTNTAQAVDLSNKLNECMGDLIKEREQKRAVEEKSKKRGVWNIILGVLLGISIIVHFRRRII